mmetsp:Transcript_14378/g.24486  ORF Transcript_14378/g.24486 Transcript_14378/m.24486 type:complete len:265 (-) Transcript_14378:1102-1896(-)
MLYYTIWSSGPPGVSPLRLTSMSQSSLMNLNSLKMSSHLALHFCQSSSISFFSILTQFLGLPSSSFLKVPLNLRIRFWLMSLKSFLIESSVYLLTSCLKSSMNSSYSSMPESMPSLRISEQASVTSLSSLSSGLFTSAQKLSLRLQTGSFTISSMVSLMLLRVSSLSFLISSFLNWSRSLSRLSCSSKTWCWHISSQLVSSTITDFTKSLKQFSVLLRRDMDSELNLSLMLSFLTRLPMALSNSLRVMRVLSLTWASHAKKSSW